MTGRTDEPCNVLAARERCTLPRFLRVSRHANDAVKDGNCKQSYSFRHSVTSGH